MSRVAQLERLLSIDPADADVMYMLAQEHAKQGDTDTAAAWFDRCLARDADYAYAYYHKAKALEAAGRIAEAKATLTDGLATARRLCEAKTIAEMQSFLASL